ncbi:MAG: hypothetical protein ACI8ZN_002424 [Bacteroidia bacterium]|jgi:hypothetical protein
MFDVEFPSYIYASPIILLIVFFGGAILVGFAGTNRKGGFLRAFLLGLFLTPLVGIILVIGSAQKNPKGCIHCGNSANEAEFCGLCGKNEEGMSKVEARSYIVPELKHGEIHS